MDYQFKCDWCDTEFISQNKRARFCSRKCFGLWRSTNFVGENNPLKKEREKRKCLICNTEFECRLKSNKNFCSHQCYWISLKGKEKFGRRTGRKYFCKICMKGFYRSKTSTKKYCSRECYLVDHSKDVRDVDCFTCGTVFKTSRKAKKLFCSRECYLIDHASIILEFECPNCHSLFEQSKNLSEKKTFCSKQCAIEYLTKDPERNAKIGQTLRRQYSEGQRESWSKGLTCKTDERLNKMSIKILEGYQFGREPHNKGTSGPGPYCDDWRDNEFKEDIKERDGWECKNPECLVGNSSVLGIHHINYDKRDCRPVNLITVCRSCNSRANFKREYWENLYSEIVNG